MSDSQPALSADPLEQRAIEVKVAAAFHGVLAKTRGTAVADEVFAEVVDQLAYSAARSISGGRPLGLPQLWEVWQRLGGDGRLDIHLDELGDRRLRFHVDKCAYAEMYRALGLEQLGTAFSCRRDRPFAEALVPGVRVEQSQTLLEGSNRCEFTYSLEDE